MTVPSRLPIDGSTGATPAKASAPTATPPSARAVVSVPRATSRSASRYESGERPGRSVAATSAWTATSAHPAIAMISASAVSIQCLEQDAHGDFWIAATVHEIDRAMQVDMRVRRHDHGGRPAVADPRQLLHAPANDPLALRLVCKYDLLGCRSHRSSARWDDLFTRCTRRPGDAQSPERGKAVALFGGAGAADTKHMRPNLKLTAAVSLLAYVAGAAAVLWRARSS